VYEDLMRLEVKSGVPRLVPLLQSSAESTGHQLQRREGVGHAPNKLPITFKSKSNKEQQHKVESK
jgi:hypothetical protein